MKQKIEIEVDIPDGYRFVRWGRAVPGEKYFDVSINDAHITDAVHKTECLYAIVEPLPKRYREPDARDVGRECEVSESGIEGAWGSNRLYVGKTTSGRFAVEFREQIESWQHARVIDDSPAEPAISMPTIDVGKGYRMADERDIGKMVEPTDNPLTGSWADKTPHTSILHVIYRESKYPFVCGTYWKYARVKVDQ